MLHNNEIEKKIEVVDALVKEMENHRDQAKLFQAAAAALKELNQQIATLDGQFSELSSEAIQTRFESLEAQSRKVATTIQGDSHDLDLKLRDLGLKISALETRQADFSERSQSDAEKLSRELKERDQSNFKQFNTDLQSFQEKLEVINSQLNGVDKKLQSSIDQSLVDIQKLANGLNKVEELCNNTISQTIELRSATREAIENTQTETRSFVEKSRDSSCELITEGKNQTIELLKAENSQIKDLITAQNQRSQKWSIILLLVGLCASSVGGAVLYLLLTK